MVRKLGKTLKVKENIAFFKPREKHVKAESAKQPVPRAVKKPGKRKTKTNSLGRRWTIRDLSQLSHIAGCLMWIGVREQEVKKWKQLVYRDSYQESLYIYEFKFSH